MSGESRALLNRGVRDNLIFRYTEKKCTECGVDLKEGSENATDPQVCGGPVEASN